MSRHASNSQTIIKKGAHTVSTRGKNADDRAIVPASTLRALKLRNATDGPFGTGEVMKIPGREKLELIAEDEMERAKEERRNRLYEESMNRSLKAPFQLDTILRIAQSQMDAYIDLINALHNPDLCYDIASREIEAHCPPKDDQQNRDFLNIHSFVAEQFGICVHNAHMLASGWVILYESFRKLQEMGLRDREIRTQLDTDATICDVYLLAYELLKKLVAALQQRLRSIVQNTPHYAPYFKSSNDVKDCQEFERAEIKRMYKSFLDSTIIELCLPGSKFSPQALYFCLHATQEETPKSLKRCPQLMWDVVGDLSEAVRLLDIMETPLINKDPELKRDEDATVYNEFICWDEAQMLSVRAVMDYSGHVNLVNPLTNLQNATTLKKIWDRLNANYIRESGQNIDALWQLVDARYRIPHFSTLTVPAGALYGGTESGERALVPAGRNNRNRKQKPKRSTYSSDSDDSASSMPSLKAISDSEDEHWESEDESDDEGSNGEDGEYDEDEEQDLKRKQREAIERSLEDPDVLDLSNCDFAEERKKNPFLSLLANLRGRLFTSSDILRTDGETTVTSRPTKVPPSKKANVPKTGDETQAKPLSTKAAVEDADKEGDRARETGKKKKPQKKKKKKKKTTNDDAKTTRVETPASPAPEPPRSPSPSPQPQLVQAASPFLPRWDKKSTPESPSIKVQVTRSNLSGSAAFASTTTLPLPHEEKAPSAHSYLKEITGTKLKVKTRREPAAEILPEKKERRNLFDRLRGKDRDVPKEQAKQQSGADIFGRLKRKTVNYARMLLGISAQDRKGSLKWEQFLQVMRELGFEYDPSTAGSSVRFDPPNPNDRSITFHKPHPDATLHQYKLKEYRLKLEAYYGWSPEVFKTALKDIGGTSGDEYD